jgi:hypothetical protein
MKYSTDCFMGYTVSISINHRGGHVSSTFAECLSLPIAFLTEFFCYFVNLVSLPTAAYIEFFVDSENFLVMVLFVEVCFNHSDKVIANKTHYLTIPGAC